MKSPICDMLDIEFPLIAFSHCRDVVAEVSRAGGMGVFGAARTTPNELEMELNWIDDHVNGKPYGVDLIIPTSFAGKEENVRPISLSNSVSPEHIAFAKKLLDDHDIPTDGMYEKFEASDNPIGENMHPDAANQLLDIAFSHPISLIANALGKPPDFMLDRGRRSGVPVAALVGAKEHAIKQIEAGVDILVVAGGEAGGHCGDVSTLVLVPEIVETLKEYGSDVPILAAGGIVTGRQMAACMAMGADGVWTGSVWLTTAESEVAPSLKEKMIVAGSRETARSKARTGKYARQLKSAWTEAWRSEGAPPTLPMPLQYLISEPALKKAAKMADEGHEGARDLASYFVGQGVGLMNDNASSRSVVQGFMEDFLEAAERLHGHIE